MKRRQLIKHLKKHGCILRREGSKHTIYINPANKQTTAIPRHIEIANRLAKKICKDLDIPTIE